MGAPPGSRRSLWAGATRFCFCGQGGIPQSPAYGNIENAPAPICVKNLALLKHTEVVPFDLVFSARKGSPLSRRNRLNRQLKPACNGLRLTGANWHWLRRAHATLLDAVGTPLGTVQALLGHSVPEITRETYIHSVPADARRAVGDVEELYEPRSRFIPELVVL